MDAKARRKRSSQGGLQAAANMTAGERKFRAKQAAIARWALERFKKSMREILREQAS